MSRIAKTFTFQIANHYDAPKTVAFFAGTIFTGALATDEETNKPVFTNANPEPVQNYAQGIVDAVLTDGILPVMKDGALVIPSKKEVEEGGGYLEARANNPLFRIEDFKKYLQGDFYLWAKTIIKVKEQDQFDKPITLRTTSPTENLGSKTIYPTSYSTPQMLQTNKIIIDDMQGTVLQNDTMMLWEINPGEVINLTFQFTESQA